MTVETKPRDYPTTMEGAWAAFWYNAKDLSKDRAELRQAFKNGAAFVVGCTLTRSHAVVDAWATNPVRLIQEVHPWLTRCMQVHSNWGAIHQDAIRAGAMAATTLHYARAKIDLEGFQPSG
jgi:hypothetical protein